MFRIIKKFLTQKTPDPTQTNKRSINRSEIKKMSIRKTDSSKNTLPGAQRFGADHPLNNRKKISGEEEFDSLKIKEGNFRSKNVSTQKKEAGRSKRKPIVAPQEKAFWFYDGPMVTNIHNLRNVLPGLSRDQFSHHVNDEKNDIAVWVETVLEDPDCARVLRSEKTKSGFYKVLDNYIKDHYA